MMQIHDLQSLPNRRKRKRIVGRGRGSGRGKTSGRGHGRKQNARAGRGILRSLEGGQIPLIRRLPKVGFRRRSPLVYQIIKTSDLDRFANGTTVDAVKLKEHRLIQNVFKPYKVLATGDMKKSLTIQAYAFSKSAVEKITQAGGKAEHINQKILKQNLGQAK